MLTSLKVSFLVCKYVFYRPEHNAKGRNPMDMNSEDLEIQKWNKPMDKKSGVVCLVIMFSPGKSIGFLDPELPLTKCQPFKIQSFVTFWLNQ